MFVLVVLYAAVIIWASIIWLKSDADSFQNEAVQTKSEPGSPERDRSPEQRDQIRIKEYELHIALYQFYFKLGLDVVSFFFLLTGGIVAYVLTNYKRSPKTKIRNVEFPILKLALLLPILLSGVFGWTFVYAANKWLAVVGKVRRFRIYLGLEKVPDMEMMYVLLLVFGYIFFVVGVALILLMLIDIDKPARAGESNAD